MYYNREGMSVYMSIRPIVHELELRINVGSKITIGSHM